MEKQILRFTTAGSVDDGKSTLIGRLLFETNSIADDQLNRLNDLSTQKGLDRPDFSMLTDGLRAEREQGITIDVAYRYFETNRRRFIIADSPGHFQYTRNMVTGASQADFAVVLVDARKGILDQTYRHTYIISLMGIRQVVLCVNKMDLVKYDEKKFRSISESYLNFCNSLNFLKVDCLPVVATDGDFISRSSANMPWYNGMTLLQVLEDVPLYNSDDFSGFRFPVQYVIRPKNNFHRDFRGYAGRIARGGIREGQEVVVLPSGMKARITGIYDGSKKLSESVGSKSVSLTLDQELDIGRGDLISTVEDSSPPLQEFDLMICWLNGTTLHAGRKFLIRHHTVEVKGILSEFRYKLNIIDLGKNYEINSAEINDLVCVHIRASRPLFPDKYADNKTMGSVILIDEVTGETLAAGIFL